MSTDQLTRVLTETLDAVTPPPADLAAVRTRARRVGRRRRATVAVAAVGAVAAAWFGAYQLADGAARVIAPDTDVAVPGGFDTGDGLRAVGAPGVRLFLGDTSVSLRDAELPGLDTDAAASSYGVLHTDRSGSIALLETTGRTRRLTGPTGRPDGAFPTIKVDPAQDLAAWMTYPDGEPTLEVYDLTRDEVVATSPVDCLGECDSLVIEAISDGHVVVRGAAGTMTWQWADEDQAWVPFAGPATRVADVQNRVVLHDGPRPARLPDGWRAVAGPVDGVLTHDGGHVVAWDRVLPSTERGGAPIRLDVEGTIFYTVDTDGSVLAAGQAKVYDCEVPSGECEQFATLPEGAGDPMFIGNDM